MPAYGALELIAFVTGVLRARGTDWVQVEVGGVGFHISVPCIPGPLRGRRRSRG